MSIRWVLLAAFFAGTLTVSPSRCQAQNGQLIEGLFRTLAESHLERERRKRLEAEEQAREEAERRATDRTRDPYEVKLPSGFGSSPPGRTPGGPPPRGPNEIEQGARRINVRSKQAADYVTSLVQFNQAYAPLVSELRGASSRNPAIRTLMPEIYELSASGRTLLNQCDGLSSLTPITSAHRDLD